MGVIILDGKSSKDYGIVVEIEPNYEVAERAYDVVSVPGRGDVLTDLHYYKNVERPYQIAVAEEGGKFTTLAPRMAEWLNVGFGYVRLEDSYYPDQYVLARISSSIDIMNVLKQAGRATITFDRCPKRFLKSGEQNYVMNSVSNTILNPTSNDAKPLIKIYGVFEKVDESCLWINGNAIIFDRDTPFNISNPVIFDCETRKVYKNDNKLNKHVKIVNDDPVLKPSVNKLVWNGNIRGVEIIPRWWIL